ncbi:MAG: Uma2 family endonuclease [Acidobacteriota bacterium]|nr:Uma2 family endonuclease [Acidobacteriota bacterium]
MTTTIQPITADELFTMKDDGFRYDLVKGELRKMSPAEGEHGIIIGRLTAALGHHIEENDLGEVFGAETGFKLASNPDTVLGPDLAFISNEKIPQSGIPVAFWQGAPDLAVEVVSPGNTRREIEEKIEEYLAAGVSLVWIINPKRRTITVHRANAEPVTLEGSDTLDGSDVVPGFTYSIARLFKQKRG